MCDLSLDSPKGKSWVKNGEQVWVVIPGTTGEVRWEGGEISPSGFSEGFPLWSLLSTPVRTLWDTVGTCFRIVPAKGKEAGGIYTGIPILPRLRVVPGPRIHGYFPLSPQLGWGSSHEARAHVRQRDTAITQETRLPAGGFLGWSKEMEMGTKGVCHTQSHFIQLLRKVMEDNVNVILSITSGTWERANVSRCDCHYCYFFFFN